MPISAEDLAASDKAVKEIGKVIAGDMAEVHTALCDDALMDRDACENYINHYTRTIMNMLTAPGNTSKDRLSILATGLRHTLLVGVNAGRDDQPLV